ncbi:hypothetical protein K469DRAFT_661529 [Zopfia rhizophila CBS 207.26]|uniref:EthD domain-containing protein n=1 Tax=Zopfia rhizophila CBS 207.26 TaxID=1314779 RepID=A0A6A6E6K1_9PEZI|nr:hypothetical protein K469DRAFT_661529 [Zopfia rhizophila CBS 207.26]
MDKHPFTFSELRPGTGSNPQPYLRFLNFFNKRPDISEDKFHECWKTVHADLGLAVAGWNGHCMRYVQQLHTTPEHKAELRKYGIEPLPFDPMGELHVKSIEDWVLFQASPAFSEKLDGENFMAGPVQVMTGYDTLVYGSRIETSGGKDGIVPDDNRLKPASKEHARL